MREIAGGRSLRRRVLRVAAGLAVLLGASVSCAGELLLRTVGQSGAIAKYAEAAQPGLPGLCVEIAQALQQVDPEIRFSGLDSRVPARRIERMLAGGEIDAFFCMLRSPERELQWVYLQPPLYRVRHRVVQRVGDATELHSLDELRAVASRAPVLVSQGSPLEQRLQQAGVATAFAPSEREAMRMLQLGRTDAVYGQDVSLLRLLADPSLAVGLRLAPHIFHEEDQWLVVSTRLPLESQHRLQRALSRLEREGVLRRLADRYR